MVKLIIANWKMNLNREKVQDFIQNLEKLDSSVQLIICPSFIHMGQISNIIDNQSVFLGAQNVNHNDANNGAYTGEISAQMLQDYSCKYCIVGHSERRILFHEKEDDIKNKILFLENHQITPIICVGENSAHREEKKEYEYIKSQLLNSIPHNAKDDAIIIAYEPVWSIGSGIIPSIKQIEEMVNFIEEICIKEIERKFKIVYGGSVNENNARDILSIRGISGVLIGSASLNINNINQIIKLAYQS